MLRMKRVYEGATRSDGRRILVDRLWPRGLSKKKAAIDVWMKDIAPSAELRKWFGHDPDKWVEFQRRYKKELRARKDLVGEIVKLARRGRVTLVYGARDQLHNDALVVAAVVKRRMSRTSRAPSATRA